MAEHTLERKGSRGWYCTTCQLEWGGRPRKLDCNGFLTYRYETKPDHLYDVMDLQRLGYKLAEGQQRVACLDYGFDLYDIHQAIPFDPNEDRTIQRGEHRVELLPNMGERCVKCERVFEFMAWGQCAGVKQYNWEPWPEGLFTEKQLREMKTEAAPWGYQVGEVRGAVYYSKAPDHFLKLYRLDEAIPKPEPSAKRQASMKRQSEAMYRAWHCQRCEAKTGRYQKDGGFCHRCAIVLWAQALLKDGFVVFDCETTGLSSDDEILQVGLVDSSGEVLYRSYVKPVNPIIEEYSEHMEWDGDYYRPHFTAFEINGISNAMVANAPSFVEMWAQLEPLMSDRIVVSYNVAFDRNMLETNCLHHNQTPSDSQWECAMEAYAQYVGDMYYRGRRRGQYRWHSLDVACTTMDCHIGPSHEAAGDCQRTLALVKAMAETPVSRSMNDPVLSDLEREEGNCDEESVH